MVKVSRFDYFLVWIVAFSIEMSFLVKIRFGTPRGSAEGDTEDVIDNYLAALMRNGQIYRTQIIKNIGLPLEAYVCIPQPGAMGSRYSSLWVREALGKVKDVFGDDPKIQFLEDPRQRRFPSWRSTKSLYLYTYMFDECSPVRSTEFEHPVPLYLLPIDSETRDDLTRWADSYRNHDSMWIGSGKLEFQAYKELADPTSELCARGMEYCKKIEKSTGKPTYFYLMRYYGKRKGEIERSCPLCGKSWALRVSMGPAVTNLIKFRCKRCRLVSSVGVDENDRYAHVGDWAK